MVYIGNWVLNSARGQDRFPDYDKVESKIFSYCKDHRMESLIERWNGEIVPSRAFAEGGIHEAIMDYEDAVFFDILAEELARRDLENGADLPETDPELIERINKYFDEFEANGIDNLVIEGIEE